jgi:hypothetical protein
VHSSIDLVASVVAFFSVRKAGEPADESHRYGHEKVENLAASIEGILIPVGSAAIAFQAIRHLATGSHVQSVGVGMAVVAFSLVLNVLVSKVIARNARLTGSPALEGDAAHLRTDALTSLAVLVGLALVKITGATGDPGCGAVWDPGVRSGLGIRGCRRTGIPGCGAVWGPRCGERTGDPGCGAVWDPGVRSGLRTRVQKSPKPPGSADLGNISA